jgi:hypothetical protein
VPSDRESLPASRPDASRSETFKFAVDSALLSELGEKLVSTAHVAVTELVKNAYDADASQVKISILPEEGAAPRIRIEDDGAGMTVDEVRKFWMKIGTSSKAAQPVSHRYGRLKTGSKGIGRFACRRLGANLRLITCAHVKLKGSGRASYQTTSVEFIWSTFEPGVDVETVECAGETSVQPTGRTGTTLEIWGGAHDEWRLRGFNYLKRQLVLLSSNRGIARAGFIEDPGFNVLLEAPGLSGELIDVRAAVLDASWGTVKAQVESDGRATCSLNAKGLGGTKKFTSTQRFSRISGTALQIGILPQRKDEARKPELLANYVLPQRHRGTVGGHSRSSKRFPGFSLRRSWRRLASY